MRRREPKDAGEESLKKRAKVMDPTVPAGEVGEALAPKAVPKR
jgi:hypothetical protein